MLAEQEPEYISFRRSERGLEELRDDMGGRNTPAVNLNGAALQESRTLLLNLASP